MAAVGVALPMAVVGARTPCRKLQLKIDNEATIEPVFYKDVGGKRSGIPVAVSLRDMATSQTAVGLPLPLVCSVRFDNQRDEIANMDQVATFFGAPYTIGLDGRVQVRFRLNDVSRNHGNRKFRLHLSCEPTAVKAAEEASGVSMEVNSCTTRPIEVLSKKPKDGSSRSGRGVGGSQSAQSLSSPATTALSSHGTREAQLDS